MLPSWIMWELIQEANITKYELAKRMEIRPPNVYNMLERNNGLGMTVISFSKMLNAVGYRLIAQEYDPVREIVGKEYLVNDDETDSCSLTDWEDLLNSDLDNLDFDD